MTLPRFGFILLFICFFWVNHTSGQLVNILGRVLFENGDPAPGIVATLQDLQMSDTTGSDGIYHLYLGRSQLNQMEKQVKPPHYAGGRLHFSVTGKQKVSIDLYNLKGVFLSRIFQSELETGNYSLNLAFDLSTNKNCLLLAKLSIGTQASCHKFVNLGTASASSVIEKGDADLMELSKATRSAGIDELWLSMNGTVLTTFEVVSYIDTMSDFIIWGNHPPHIPALPIPENNSINNPLSTVLSWTGGDPDQFDTATYAVYLDTTNPPLNQVSSGLSPQYLALSGLQLNTTYYWYVESTDGKDTVASEIWSFTTLSPVTPVFTIPEITETWNTLDYLNIVPEVSNIGDIQASGLELNYDWSLTGDLSVSYYQSDSLS
jgi:hypothetical protein